MNIWLRFLLLFIIVFFAVFFSLLINVMLFYTIAENKLKDLKILDFFK